jgi:hypothetical protein
LDLRHKALVREGEGPEDMRLVSSVVWIMQMKAVCSIHASIWREGVKADQPMSLEATLIVMNAHDRSMDADTERDKMGTKATEKRVGSKG